MKKSQRWRPAEKKSDRTVCYVYCDVKLRKEVKVYEPPKEVPYKTIPTGWGYGSD